MSNFFTDALSDVKSLEERLLGPDYKYFKFINSPDEMGMSANGSLSTLAKDIGGLIGYVELLVAGGGKASKVDGPLGNKFFLATGAKCNDLATNNKVTRSIYVNNVPDGTIPFITAALDGQRMTDFEGLVPGTMSNLAQINPMKMFQAFMTGSNPDCQQIAMETIDVNNVVGYATAFVTVDDINSMNSYWFPNNTKPAILPKIPVPAPAKEGFSNINYSKMPDDVLIKVYYSALGLLGLYIFLRLFQKKIK
jgi:hypothetical protein